MRLGSTASALLIMVPLFGLAVVAACASPSTPGSPTAASSAPTIAAPSKAAPTSPAAVAPAKPNPSPTALPRTYGELKVGLANFAGGAIDPQKSPAFAAAVLGYALFDSLVGVTANGQPGPGVAERWEMSADGKTWTFFIRRGIKFHDGSDLTASDVKFSIDRAYAPDASGTNAVALRGIVDSVDVKDDYTVLLKLKQPDGEIWKWLSPLGASEGEIVPKKYLESKGVEYFRSNPIGSGPWKFVKYDYNVAMELEAVETHWRAVPNFKKLRILNIPEESTRVAMLKTGELDLIQITPEKVSDVKSAGFKVASIEAAGQGGFVLYQNPKNQSAYPVGDVRVRKALSLGINRQEIAEKLFSGYSSPTALQGMSSSSIYFDSSVLKPDPYDPTEAKKLLAEAGFPNGFTIKLYPSGLVAWSKLLSEAVAGYWEKVGVKTTLDVRDWAALRPMISPAHQPDIAGNSVMMYSAPYPNFALRIFYTSKAFHGNIGKPELDALIDKTEATMDPTERKKVALQAALMAKNEYTFPGVVDVSELLATGKNIGQWTPIKGFSLLALEYERIPHAQ